MLKYSFSFSPGERKIFRRKRHVAISEWAERHRVLEMSSIPGKWQNLFTPYLTGIMDACGTPGIETVIICKSPQTGGSEAGHNLVGWCIDRSPGPVMYVFPDEITARENARDRIIPMIRASARLRSYMTGSDDDASSLRINLLHMPIYLGWSGSVSRLGNKPIRTLVLDELDKYKNPQNEASSEVLAEKRTITWRHRKHIIKISTPTTEDGPIWRAYTQEAQARFDFWVKCPDCGKRQPMQFDNICWPGKNGEKEPDPEDVLAARSAWYVCRECGSAWDDNHRDLACRAGIWQERSSGLELFSYIETRKPVKIAFHIPAWLSYFVSLSEIAAAALRYKKSGRLEDLKDLQNQYKAEPWKQEAYTRSDAAILALCDDRPAGMVPAGDNRVSCLLAGVDTQGMDDKTGYFPYVIRAFGFSETEESWLVKAGIARTLADLEKVLFGQKYLSPDGREYQIRACMIDAMGQRTREIYTWAIAHRGQVFPWQGKKSLDQPYSASLREWFIDPNGAKIRIPGGVSLWKCDTTFFKSDLARRLAIAPTEPGAFHLYSNSDGSLNEYAKQMCVEIWDDERMGWENPKRRPNHFWDCETMCLALAYILNVRFAKSPLEIKPRPPAQKPARKQPMSIADRLGAFRR